MTNNLVNELIDLGVDQKRSGNYDKAIEYYNRAKDIEPGNAEIYNALGKVNYIQEDYHQAMGNFFYAATISARFINNEAQLNSLMTNFGRHMGYSFIASKKQNQDIIDIEFVDEAIGYYRTLIDPYYRDLPSTPRYSNNIEVERKIILYGMFYMNDLSKFAEYGQHLKKASEYYFKLNFNL